MRCVGDCIEEVNANQKYRTEGNDKVKNDIETISKLFMEHDDNFFNGIIPALNFSIELDTCYILGTGPPGIELRKVMGSVIKAL